MAGVERKVTQLDADVHAIYAMVDDIRKDVRTLRGSVLRQGTRLDQIEADLQGVAESLQGLAEAQSEHGRTLVVHGEKLDRIIALLDGSA